MAGRSFSAEEQMAFHAVASGLSVVAAEYLTPARNNILERELVVDFLALCDSGDVAAVTAISAPR